MMHWMQLQQFLLMGGYAKYVWPAYGITFSILLGNVILPLLKHKKILRQQGQKIAARENTSSIQHGKHRFAPYSLSQKIVKKPVGTTNECNS